MAQIMILGGGVGGLATAIMLARDGHDVRVLERDSADVPETVEEAWERWARPGVAQFRQPHFLQARVRGVLDRELPEIRDALLAAGAAVVDPLERMPPSIDDRSPRPDDDRFISITARRPTVEYVLARAAANEPRVEVRRGEEVVGLTAASPGSVTSVTGVRTRSNGELTADLVVDAMGRSSKLPRWLHDIGAAPVQEEAEDCGFVYYTRYFRARDGEGVPVPRTPGLLTPIGSFSIVTLPCDRRTWSVTVYTSTGDQPLKAIRKADRWAALVQACPLHAHWLDGEPITDVLPMAGVLDRYRRLAVDGRPRVTGLALVADAWACTNPSVARGLALGLDHASRLRDVVRLHLDDPAEFAAAWDQTTEDEFTPWYRATVATDRGRLAEVEAYRSGMQPAPARDRMSEVRARFPMAAGRDPEVLRALFEIIGCLALPSEVFARDGFVERILELTDGLESPGLPGPTRDELLAIVSG